jgi:hypothetical protein
MLLRDSFRQVMELLKHNALAMAMAPAHTHIHTYTYTQCDEPWAMQDEELPQVQQIYHAQQQQAGWC